MDRECVLLLPRVCDVLADSGRSLPDDTSLEKLLDWFTGLTKTGVSLLESCPHLTEFITTVIEDKDSDPSVLSFTIKLTGLIASTVDGFIMLQENSVLGKTFDLQHWQDAGVWEDPCLRIGWIQGLKNMLQHSQALSFFVQSDFIKPLLKLKTDTSLFVASAANQMLAHIMLFFQSASSAGSNCADDRHDKENGSTKVFNTDLKQLAADHTAVVKVISVYLRESLLPKDNTKLHQSLQTLKLLALVLAEAGPSLRDELLQNVTVSLEEVVTAGCSQLTLPLMHVLLAEHRGFSADDHVPDQRVDRLLSSMLNINKPCDLIQAAAVFLHSSHQDASHTAQAVRILLLPLQIITGHNLLGSSTTAPDHHISMVEHLKRKSSCVSVICTCLSTAANIILVPSGLAPCPPALIISAVLSLLRICSGDASSLSSGCHVTCRNLIGNCKVQKCALDALISLSSSQGVQEEVSGVLEVLIQNLTNPDSDPIVLHKSYQALVKWIGVCKDHFFSVISDHIREDLSNVVKKRTCDMRWEVRDSTVEFLGHVADIRVLKSAAEVFSVSEALLGHCCTISLLRKALQDVESYVRASAISALAKTQTHNWQQGAALSQEEADIVSQMLEILSQDTEGFARRAVVRYFIAWFSCSPYSSLLMQDIRTVLSQGSADLDWEVKFHTLELAEQIMDKAFSDQRGYRKDSNPTQPHPYGVFSKQTYTLHTHTEGVELRLSEALKDLVELGVVSVLLSGLVDCDRPVGLKACRLLITLRETVLATTTQVSCKFSGQGLRQEVRKLLSIKTKDFTEEERKGLNGAEKDSTEDECVVEEGKDVIVDVCEVLRSLDLNGRLEVLIQSSDHIHNSPLSLLQDILTARPAHTHTDTQSGQEVIVDCY